MGPEFLQRYDEAVKRFNENKTQDRNKAAPKGGVGVNASMIVFDQEEGDTYVSCWRGAHRALSQKESR